MGSQLVASINNGVITYAHQDHLGGTNVITNAAGTKTEVTEYKPFGEIKRRDRYGSSQEVAWYYFTGKKLDDETGLYYYGARYYNPIIGRFLTPDTIVQSPLNPQTLNRYTYCNNNPINLIDPTGHAWSWKKFFGAAVGAFISVVSFGALAPVGIALTFGQGVLFGAISGALGGAASAAISGGNVLQGMAMGAAFGGVFGGLGQMAGAAGIGKQFMVGSLVAGGAYAAATGNLDSFAGGFLGGMAGVGVTNSEQFKNFKTGRGFRSNATVNAENHRVESMRDAINQSDSIGELNDVQTPVLTKAAIAETISKSTNPASVVISNNPLTVSTEIAPQNINWSTIGEGVERIVAGTVIKAAGILFAPELGPSAVGVVSYGVGLTFEGATDVFLGIYGKPSVSAMVGSSMKGTAKDLGMLYPMFKSQFMMP